MTEENGTVSRFVFERRRTLIMSILAIVAASIFALFTIVCVVNVKDFSLKDEDDLIASVILVVLFLLCMGLTSWWGVSMHGWKVQIAGMTTFTAVGYAYLVVSDYTPDKKAEIMKNIFAFFSRMTQPIMDFANGIRQRITHNDASVRGYARKRVSALCSLIPGVAWSDMRDQIASVGITALASLLARRKMLKTNISATARIIKKYEGNLSSDVMRQLHSRTRADIETFRQELAKTEAQIDDIIGFLDEVESDVRMALISDDGHAELDKRLLLFASTIQSVKADERVAEREVLSFVDHTSASSPESFDSASQTHSVIQRAVE